MSLVLIIFLSRLKKDFMRISVNICLHAGVSSPFQQLSAGAYGWISLEWASNRTPVQPNLAIWKSESGSFSGNSPRFSPPWKMCYSSTYLHSIVCKIAFNVAWTVQTIKPWDIYENYKSASGWTVLLNSPCFTRDLRHTMWLNCCDLADFCGIKMQRYETEVLFWEMQ